MSATTIVAAIVTVAGMSLPVETLTGEARVFPRDASQPRSVFVLTFSKAASSRASDWTRELRRVQGKLKAAIFQVAVIEDVPGLFRTAVISALAHGVPAELHDHFWVAAARTADWERCVEAMADDEPHVFVLDGRERIVWRARGRPDEATLRGLLQLPLPPE
jgi:hypothetical protein